MVKITKTLVLPCLGIFIFGCDSAVEPKFIPGLVVNGQLTAGHTIDSIYISWSEDITEVYDNSQVSNALVTINGKQLLEYKNNKGVYYLPDRSFIVQSGKIYHLEVEANGKKVTSDTKVPALFNFTSSDVQNGDTVLYIPGNSWVSDAFFTLQWLSYNDPDVLIYRILSFAEETTPENFIQDDRAITDLLKGADRIEINPLLWWTSDDFKYARINWMYFNWRGWHSVIVSAMDENYYLYRNGVLFGEQRSGQQFNQVVVGGYGLFCSAADDTIRVFIVD